MQKVEDIGIVKNLVKKGEVSPLTVELINIQGLCEVFGWTPKQVEEMDIFYLNAFNAILEGRRAGQKAVNPKR